ncbi:hypothetical protein CPB97_007507 [Podila verticillata]|nr:hypothetical protein CPB97_007507 [Podila verticillata]
MILSPGLQTVSLKMFRRMGDMISRAISGGVEDDKKDIIGLSASGKYKYLGLHSGTKMVVGSIMGEALVVASEVHFKEVKSSRPSQQKRDLKLKVIELGELSDVNSGLRMTMEERLSGIQAVILFLLPLVTIAGVVLAFLAEDYGASALIILNVICNMAVTFTVRGNGIRYPRGEAALGSPRGDALVENADGTEMCLILANENTLQYLFQKSMIVPPNPQDIFWSVLQVSAAYLSYMIAIVNIIAIPYCSAVGQLVFGILMFIGAAQNLTLSAFDGKKQLVRSMRRLFETKTAEGYTFQTRSSAIAYCMLRSKCTDTKQMQSLLCDTATFGAWYERVAEDVKLVCNGTESANYQIDQRLRGYLDIDLKDALKEINAGRPEDA